MRFPKFDLLRQVLCLGAIVCLGGGALAQSDKQSDFKNLAGPADEIASMRLPDPATLGMRSKTAMIPFRGTGKLIQVPVESTENLRVVLISGNVKNLSLSVSLPGQPLSEKFAAGEAESSFGFDGNQYPAKAFSLNATKAGTIGIVIRGNDSAARGGNEEGFIVVSSDSRYQLYSYLDRLNTVTNGSIGFVASVFDTGANSEDRMPNALTRAVRGAELTVTEPGGAVTRTRMPAAGGGAFRANFVPASAGQYTAQITVRGVNADGEEFIRTSEHIFQAENGAQIGTAATAQIADEMRWQINLPAAGVSEGQKVLAHAEVWGTDAAGNERSIGWIGGMSLAERSGKRGGSIPLSLDSRWLAGGEMASYELRNMRLQNPDSMVVLGEQASVRVSNIYATDAARESFSANRGQITEEMRMGKRPVREIAPEAVGGKLMLVHGYCSGDAWPNTAQFSNYVKFLDLNKNRTHDQFANLIKNFGASLPSYGIVAHSQGGAAALHLYTYYWSGLDSATGSRLIQSVGTPYQGTALAGNLAAIGSVFGAGCGSNNDLTYSGAASWLAGIPSWARAKVYYHTTSFEDVWYRYDYCNMATDLFLGDPDDGVVERAYAQLPGASNMGHKTGWCHTTSMRDPGQTTDSARNATMNSAAAR